MFYDMWLVSLCHTIINSRMWLLNVIINKPPHGSPPTKLLLNLQIELNQDVSFRTITNISSLAHNFKLQMILLFCCCCFFAVHLKSHLPQTLNKDFPCIITA